MSRHVITGKCARRRTALACAALLLTAGQPAAAQSDLELENLLFDLCIFNPPANPSDKLLDLCGELLDGFGSGFGSQTGISSNNLGGVGAQGRVSGPDRQQRLLDERIDPDDEDSGVRGGSASGDFKLGNLGVFMAASTGEDDRSTTALETGFESDVRGVSVGLNYLFSDELIGGVLLGYNSQDSDFDGGAGSLDSRSRSLSAYVTWTPLANAYLGAYAGYARVDQDSVRIATFGTVSSTAFGDPEARQKIAGISAGYDHFMGAASVGAFANLDYAANNISAYTEQDTAGLAFHFPRQRIRSVKSTLGIRADYSFDYSWGTLIPAARAAWVHEFRDDARTINATLAAAPGSAPIALRTDSPDRNYLLFGAGVTAIASDSVQLFMDYERMEGHRFLDTWTLSAGFVASF